MAEIKCKYEVCTCAVPHELCPHPLGRASEEETKALAERLCGPFDGHSDGFSMEVAREALRWRDETRPVQAPPAAVPALTADSKMLAEFVRMCRENKPVGQWPGERVCVAIDRLLKAQAEFVALASGQNYQAAWFSVCDALDKALPGWGNQEGTGVEAACKAIEVLDALAVEQTTPTPIPEGCVVSEAMVESALKVLAFENDCAVFPDAYSDEEVEQERATMRKVLAAALAAKEGE